MTTTAPPESTETVLPLDGTRPLGRDLVGGKAYSLNRMRSLGLPVPPAFAITVDVCTAYHAGGTLPDDVWAQVLDHLAHLEERTGRRFGGPGWPLLVSVRSGAARSMPGMMDTVLNLGLTAELRDTLAEQSGDPAWAADTWERFERSYSGIVGGPPPADPREQLRAAIGAVFRSWFSPRAVSYREHHGITDLGGTAVTVQAMAFGNRDAESGTGVLFSRDPGTGEPGVYGEWLARAQGEDVVSGERTPARLDELARTQPGNHRELLRLAGVLEREYGDMVDVEFTIESGTLYVLQARAGKRTPGAAARIAVDLVGEGLIDVDTALTRVTPAQATQLLETAGAAEGVELARGTGAGPGLGVGQVVTDPDEALDAADAGTAVVLVRPFTSPEDVPAMFAAAAVVTEHGGSTSHAALVCREAGIPCVVGCGDGTVDALRGRLVTVDGTTGAVLDGDRASGAGTTVDGPAATLTEWAAARTGGDGALPELLALVHSTDPAEKQAGPPRGT
ncbi:pyruvate, phosphate dikinase [Amycolatopsis sp. NPDC001319]|uniref:pyruvate, phosphate dikinase n=1 Tax=unclassified Amycolatopsis TaxID=2618356 RepID=UPI0036C3E999